MNSSEDHYEWRFSFVRNKTLKDHLGDALKCAVELTVIAKKYPPLIRSTFYKTSIIHLASIIEALLHYCANEMLGDTYEHPEWTYCNIKKLHEVEKDNFPKIQIIAGERYKKIYKLSRYIDFKVLNRLCLKEKILNKKLYSKVEKIRNLRNKIHLFGLKSIDRKFQKRDVEFTSKIAYDILKTVENKL
ncbi:hypothetical protein ISS42_02305 [Candidatus Shapirobacteria bacterium]|nr:hypothetical protein [Candidatus Shapirobacteria bacterium]